MAGVGLGRLWDTHPKVAFVIHLLLTVYFGVLAVGGFLSGNTGGGVVLTIGFAVMAGSLVTFTWLAAQSNWQADEASYDGRGQVVSPRAAWANTRAWGRILWVLFGVNANRQCDGAWHRFRAYHHRHWPLTGTSATPLACPGFTEGCLWGSWP